MKKLLLLCLVALGGVMNASADDVYTVVGNENLMGTDWNLNDESNEMTLCRDNTFILTKTVTFTGDNAIYPAFKVVKNHNYSNGEWPSSGNQYITIPNAGTYEITFVFNLGSNQIFAFTSSEPIYVQFSLDNGSTWKAEKMTVDASDPLKYSFVSDFDLSANTIQYLFHAEKNEYRYQLKNGDANFTYGINESQKFQLSFNIDLGTNSQSLGAERVVNIGESGYATFSSIDAHNFSGTGLNAYIIKEITASSAKLTAINDVPGQNGVILKAAPGRYTVPFGTGSDDCTDNKLYSAHNGYTVVNDGDVYILSNGKFHPANAGTIPAGRAYIPKSFIPSAARSLSLKFDDATGIGTLQTVSVEDNVFYNLGGQRVAAPTKGMYIVNGKKVIIK